jgi:UMF1 family MFS transporter
MAIYTMHVSRAAGLTDQAAAGQRDLIMLSAITCAIPAGLVWGRFTDRLGPKRTLNAVLYTWMFTFALAAAIGLFTLPVTALYVVACLAGISMSGTWASDRPFMLRLTPPHRVGEFYGLYGMVGRFSAIAGPAIWAVTTWVFVEKTGLAPQQGGAIAILVLLGMVILSHRILKPVSDTHRA